MGIELDPARGIHSARRLAAAAAGIAHVRDTVGAEIETAHEAKPWGDDELGTTFASTYADAASRLASGHRPHCSAGHGHRVRSRQHGANGRGRR